MWDEAKGRAAHEKRQLYTALVGSSTTPECFVESTGHSIGVGFLDELLREHLSYEFQEKHPGRLFLSMATERKFDGDTDKVIWGITYYFDEDGHVAIEEEDFVGDTLISAETYLDVSANWERYPDFGDYESIARKDRVALIPIADKKDSLFE
jgi:hypothetical protein